MKGIAGACALMVVGALLFLGGQQLRMLIGPENESVASINASISRMGDSITRMDASMKRMSDSIDAMSKDIQSTNDLMRRYIRERQGSKQ